MYLMELSVAPLDKGPSVGSYVARSVSLIEASGLDFRLHAMGTVVEGNLEQVLEVLRQCLEATTADCDRVSCSVKLDFRRGYRGRLESKVTSVERHLGHETRRA